MNMFCVDDLPMAQIQQALSDTGACALPVLNDDFRERLLAEARLYPFRPARKEVGRDHERVKQRMDVEPNLRADSLFHHFTAQFQNLFDTSRRTIDPFEDATVFNDLMLQRYTIGEIGITPHRDRTHYRNIVCLFVLRGRGRFCVSHDRDAAHSIEIANGPGDVILMRAPGFKDAAGQTLPRPFHFVHQITEPRYVFGLRHDVA